jgi:hypothetical protein
VIDVEPVEDDVGGSWWCNDCRREFEEPETPRWWSRYRCPHCGGGAGIEWVEPEPADDAEADESIASQPVGSGPVAGSLVGWRDCYLIRAECGHLLAGKVTPPGSDLPRTLWAWCSACERTVHHQGWLHEHGSNLPAHAIAGWLVEEEPTTSNLAELSPAPVLRAVLGR